jgi:hypothetical protein
MGLSLLGVTFSSTIISCCTCNFGCADVRGVVAVAVVMVVARGDGDDDGCHGLTGHGEGVCCCVSTHSPPGA